METLEGVVRIYNRSEKIVTDLINGTRVTVPPRGSVETSARRAQVMLERHQGVLTSDASYAKQTYSKEDMDMVDLMDEVHLRKCLLLLMSGGMPDIKKVYNDQINSEKAKK